MKGTFLMEDVFLGIGIICPLALCKHGISESSRLIFPPIMKSGTSSHKPMELATVFAEHEGNMGISRHSKL